MASRAVGASFALVAALLLATALVGALAPSVAPAWWDGHPQVGQKTFEHKAVHVGLVGARGCNLGETVQCESLDMGGFARAIGIVELIAMVALAAAAGLLGFAIWRGHPARARLGRIAIALAIAGAVLAVVRIAIGPEIHAGQLAVGVPLGAGFFTFAGGAVGIALAGVSARAGASRPRPRGSVPSFTHLAALEPSRASHPILPTPRGLEPAVDALAPTQPAPPLFDHAGGNGALRPLYDLDNAGVVPMPPKPRFPERAPTPIPRSSVLETGEAPTRHASPPPPASVAPPASPASLAPPRPSKPSAPPPIPPRRADLDGATAVEIDAEAKARHLAAQGTVRHPASKPPPISVPKSIPLRPFSVPVATPPPPKEPLAIAPISTAPASLPPPAESALHAAGPMPACPQCDAPMAWVEEHLRFFCKQCRMYF